MIKLWTIRTNECESTIDGHDDKIWALDLSPCGTALFSGGADSKIAVWRDTTTERDDAVKEAEEKNIIMEQKLANHLRHKQYEEALEIALELDKPHQVLRVRRYNLFCYDEYLDMFLVNLLMPLNSSCILLGTDGDSGKGHEKQSWSGDPSKACSKLAIESPYTNSSLLPRMEYSCTQFQHCHACR